MYVRYPDDKEREVCIKINRLEKLNKIATDKLKQRNEEINELQQQLEEMQEQRRKFKGYNTQAQTEFSNPEFQIM